MSFLAALPGIGSILGGLSGIFGRKRDPSPRDNIMSQAQGARDAAEKYGFNPLTLLQYGQPGGAMGSGGGAPPLASIQMLVDGLASFDPERRGDEERQRQADQLNLDLARLKLEQARSGVIIAPRLAADTVSPTPSPLGRRPVTVMQGGSAGVQNARMVAASAAVDKSSDCPTCSGGSGLKNWVIGDREVQNAPATNSAGVFELENRLTGGPVTIPGDGEPWGIDELVTSLVVGGPQVAYNWASSGAKKLGAAITEREVSRLRDKGVHVMKIDGEYYAQAPDTPKLGRQSQVLIPGQHVNMHGATRNRAMGF